MTIFRRAPPGLIASGVLVLGLFFAASAATYAKPVPNEVMFVNVKTGKCVTIAGGVSTDNNVQSVQFDCDSHPARRWMMNEVSSGIYQLRNVRTRKCLTIAGGESHTNNVRALQFDCDADLSRRWTIRLKL
jgi:cytolethal distending toxin subunit A